MSFGGIVIEVIPRLGAEEHIMIVASVRHRDALRDQYALIQR